MSSALHRLLVPDRGPAREGDDDVARNVLAQVAAHTLQHAGDQVVNAKTVLAWLLTSVGAPGWALALLVPIRESGSMLPQAAISPWVQSQRHRKRVWLAGAAGQALAAGVLALVAATLSGVAAGLAVLGALAVFALARALCSLAGKDVLGRTVPKGQRGQVNGLATVFGGAVAIALGLALRVFTGDRLAPETIAVLLAAAVLAWLAALAAFATVREPTPATSPYQGSGWLADAVALLRSDRAFRRFVIVRTLLLVSALSPPFVVALGAGEGTEPLAALGAFIVAQGAAELIGGRTFGRLADRSSKRLMMFGAALASAIVLAFLALRTVDTLRHWTLLYPLAFFLLALTHTGVRVARKTYVVDMAEGDRRTEYVAVANTAMGVLLLMIGAVSGALAAIGPVAALLFLAVLGAVGVMVGGTLPEVEHVQVSSGASRSR